MKERFEEKIFPEGDIGHQDDRLQGSARDLYLLTAGIITFFIYFYFVIPLLAECFFI